MNRESAPRAEVAILAALAVLVGATATTRARTRDELNTLHTIPGVAEQIRLPGERPEPQDLDPRHQAVISVPSEFSQPLERVGEVAAPNTVEIAQYGEYEADLAYRDGGFLAVRFDPPFVPPYRITAIRFPSITTDGASAVFPSVRLCTAGGPFDGPQVTNPLVQVAPYVGSAHGANEIPVSLAVSDSGQTFYVCVEFPSTAVQGFPSGFPFMRMDYTDLDRGLFGNSCSITQTGLAGVFQDRNFIVSLVCELPDQGRVPIEGASNLGANRLTSEIEFTFTPAGDLRADGSSMRRNSLLQTLLLCRTTFGPWTVVDTAGPGESVFSFPRLPSLAPFWSAQAVDKNGNRAVLSSGPYLRGLTILGDGLFYDYDEPNGSLRESRPIFPSSLTRSDACAPAGDQDFYCCSALPGDVIDVHASPSKDGKNDLVLALFLYDRSGKQVAVGSPSSLLAAAALTYPVPSPSPRSQGSAPATYILLIRDINGSALAPTAAPRTVWTPDLAWYHWSLIVHPRPNAAPGPGPADAPTMSMFRVSAGPSTHEGVQMVYSLPSPSSSSRVSLRIFDLHGRLLRTLLNGTQAPGQHTILWDARRSTGERLPAGVYFAEFVSQQNRCSTKIVLLW